MLHYTVGFFLQLYKNTYSGFQWKHCWLLLFSKLSEPEVHFSELAPTQREVIKYAISDITHSIWQQFEPSKSHTGMNNHQPSQ